MSVEILAPGGSVEGIYAAMLHGADAIYTGTQRFSARAFADNPSVEQLCDVLDFAHVRDKKIYLTVNTLLTDEELEDHLYDLLLPLYDNGLDAVIVQDIGVMQFIHEAFPALDIHASTQMTIVTADGANQWKPYGVTRVVPARELSIGEIAQMRKHTDLEMEVFVHGALCYCYSGQCMMSQSIGGRSGNRGMCAQPCRLPYRLSSGKTGYYLSPKDMCTLGQVGELMDAGVDSFKIEGRMKKLEYAAMTARLYRMYADAHEAGIRPNDKELEKDVKKLMDLYNRGGFCKGYLFEKDKKEIIYKDKNGHYGVEVGTVLRVKKGEVVYRLTEEISYQDVLEFRDAKGEKLYEYTVKNGCVPPAEVTARYQKGCVIKPGQKVFRTKNAALLQEIDAAVEQEKKEDKLPVQGTFQAEIGKEMRLQLSYGAVSCEVTGIQAEPAKGKAVSAEDVRKRLHKTGESEFTFSSLEVSVEEGAFLPLGQIAALRREGFAELGQKLKEKQLEKRRKIPAKRPETPARSKKTKKEHLFANVTDFRQIYEVKSIQTEGNTKILPVFPLEWFPGKSWKELADTMGDLPFMISLPVILDLPARKHFLQIWKQYGQELQKGNLAGILIQSLEHLTILKQLEIDHLPRIAGPRLYQWNERTRQVYQKFGTEDHVSLAAGRLAVMVTKGCVNQQTENCLRTGGKPVPLEITTPKKDGFVSVPICEYCCNFCYEKEGKVQELQCEDDLPMVDLALVEPHDIRKVLKQWNFLS